MLFRSKIKDTSAQRKSTNTYIFNATRLVNINRVLANGKALEREAGEGLREQLLTITDGLQRTVDQLARSNIELRKLNSDIKEIGQPKSVEQSDALRAMEKRRAALSTEIKKLESNRGWEEKTDAVIDRYSQVIAEERELTKGERQLPIERVEGAADRIDAVTRELRLVNERVQKAGRPTDEAKMAALAELKDRRKDLGNELKKLRAARPAIAEENKLEIGRAHV